MIRRTAQPHTNIYKSAIIKTIIPLEVQRNAFGRLFFVTVAALAEAAHSEAALASRRRSL
jgi:hypothetical protein